jgi:photosystem II stability/assembly factor-like uncharacterized protein
MKIKKILCIPLTLGFALTIGGCSKVTEASNKPTIPEPPSWKVAAQLSTKFSVYNSVFVNDQKGVTVGSGGEVHFTNDNGKNWGNGNNSSYCLFGVSMINDKVGWACGNGAYVVKTANGGVSWKAVEDFGESEPNHPRFISFIDENTGWVATPREFDLKGKKVKLGCTKDGGKTWEAIELPNDSDKIAAVSLRTEKDGYVLDKSGSLYITADGGKTFSKQTLDLSDIDYMIKYSPSIALRFLDDRNAIICYRNNDGKLEAAKSSDGGKTWVKENLPEIFASSVNLSLDGKVLTATFGDGSINVLSYK